MKTETWDQFTHNYNDFIILAVASNIINQNIGSVLGRAHRSNYLCRAHHPDTTWCAWSERLPMQGTSAAIFKLCHQSESVQRALLWEICGLGPAHFDVIWLRHVGSPVNLRSFFSIFIYFLGSHTMRWIIDAGSIKQTKTHYTKYLRFLMTQRPAVYICSKFARWISRSIIGRVEYQQ